MNNNDEIIIIVKITFVVTFCIIITCTVDRVVPSELEYKYGTTNSRVTILLFKYSLSNQPSGRSMIKVQ